MTELLSSNGVRGQRSELLVRYNSHYHALLILVTVNPLDLRGKQKSGQTGHGEKLQSGLEQKRGGMYWN